MCVCLLPFPFEVFAAFIRSRLMEAAALDLCAQSICARSATCQTPIRFHCNRTKAHATCSRIVTEKKRCAYSRKDKQTKKCHQRSHTRSIRFSTITRNLNSHDAVGSQMHIPLHIPSAHFARRRHPISLRSQPNVMYTKSANLLVHTRNYQVTCHLMCEVRIRTT